MNKLIISILALFALSLFTSCGDDEEKTTTEVDFDYHAHVNSPNVDDKHVNDAINISVDFESHTGETVHHVNVRIYNESDGTEVYNKPVDGHVHDESGEYAYTDTFILSNDNGVTAHSDWILEAKVWGHEVGAGEVVETVKFHVHPE